MFSSTTEGITDAPINEEIDPEKTIKLRLITHHLLSDIDTKKADIILIVCGFVSGLVDGTSFAAWGSFSSMQTGNCVFVGIGVSGQPRYPAYLWAKSLIAITTFIVGILIFSRFMRFLGTKCRIAYITCFAIQSIALLITSLIVQLDIVSPRVEDPRAPIVWMQILPISLLAFQAAGQIVASRTLEYDELPTVVLTTLLCDMLIDRNLLWKDNPKRNRRAACFIALICGAMMAGGLFRLTGINSSLWVAFALKAALTISWFFWKSEAPNFGADAGQEMTSGDVCV